MIAFITLCYSAIVWLVFFKLRLLPWSCSSQIAVLGIGVVGILALLISMNLFQPHSTDVRVYERVVQIVPRVTGRVIEVPVKANTRVTKGDVLFRIDPRPFQYEVDRLTADVDLKRIVYEDAKALSGARVAAEIKRDHARAAFHGASAQLASARLDLAEATVYSAIEGWVTNLALAQGQIASQMASLPVMTVVSDEDRGIIATFAQPALAFVHQVIQIIRRVVIRMTSWLNYVTL